MKILVLGGEDMLGHKCMGIIMQRERAKPAMRRFRRVTYSGVTMCCLAQLVGDLITDHFG